MSTVTTDGRTLTDWLEELVRALPVDRRMISIEGLRAGLRGRRIECRLHGLDFDWLGAFRHLNDTELAHRREHPDGRLHRVGDLVPASVVDDRPAITWPTATCRHCNATVIWAWTGSGGRVPVDAEHDPAGTVVLTAQTVPVDNRPLAVFLYSEAGRDQVADVDIYRKHTCPRKGHR